MSIRYHGSVQRQDDISALTIAVNACNRSSLSSEVGVATWTPEGASCVWPYLLEVNEFTVPIYGCISPIFVLLTILTNFLVCLVLVKKHMRSPTNAILVAMAISDTLTGVWPIPCFVYFYVLNRHHDYVPYEWCFAYFCLTEYLPTIFHTASIWLTVALAAQRYVYVCHPAHAKRLCTIPNIVKVILAIYIFAIASQLCRFAEYEYFPVDVPSRDVGSPAVRLRRACYYDFTPLIHRHQNLYFNLYYWFRVVFIHFVPCTSLVILNLALIVTMRSAQRRRGALLQTATSGYDCARVLENNSTTLMLVTVVGVSLLVELPLAFLFIVIITENTFDVEILANQTSYSASLFLNMFILISYPFNFFIYCGMSQQFRRTFRSLFVTTISGPADGREHGTYLSIAVRVPAPAAISDTPV